jgi:zinc transporter ZupT
MRFLNTDNLTTLTNLTDVNGTTNETLSTNLIEKHLVWGLGMLTTLMLLVLSVILTSFIVCLHTNINSKNTMNKIIIVLVSLAVGSLLGDALIHIIPEVYATEEEHHDEETTGRRYLNSTDLNVTNDVTEEESVPTKSKNICSLLIIVGFMVCFLLEKLFVIFGDEHSHSHGISEEEDETENTCKHTSTEIKEHDNPLQSNKDINNNEVIKDSEKNTNQENIVIINEKDKVKTDLVVYNEVTTNEKDVDSLKKELEKEKVPNINNEDENLVKLTCCEKLSFKGKKTVGILSTLSSLLHNFIDGLAIGVVFGSRVKTTIASTIIAIFLHEIPKEIADAGVLIHSDFTTAGILFWNVVNNVTGILGTIIGLAIGTINKTSEAYCLAFVSGNFLYISLSEMIPLLINLKKGLNNVFIFSFMILGFGIMFLILLFEHDKH